MAGEPRLMFSTLGCPGWTLEQAADTAVAIGYGGLEIRMLDGTIIPPDLNPPGRTRIREVMQSRELRTIGLGLSTRFTMPDGAERERMEQDLLAYLEMARELDVPFVRTFGGNLADGQATEDGINNVAESLNRLASAAADAGVTILLETLRVRGSPLLWKKWQCRESWWKVKKRMAGRMHVGKLWCDSRKIREER